MPGDAPDDAAPGEARVREQLERMIASDVFRGSPQLAAFLRYVVEAVLHGHPDRIKGYTIGVEVLRRDLRFDPQADPIVRVEATRLRRAIERYYVGPGVEDTVAIDIPRGSYVPIFRWRSPASAAQPVATAAAPSGAGLNAIPRAAIWIGAAVVAAVAVWFVVHAQQDRSATNGEISQRSASALPPGNGMPVLFIQPFDITGAPSSGDVAASALHDTLSDAFARFDLVNIVWEPMEGGVRPAAEPKSHIDYRLVGSAEYASSAPPRLRFRLIDAGSGGLIWSQSFEPAAQKTPGKVVEENLVRELAATLVQPFGVIYANGVSRDLATGTGDPRYRCILDAVESFRSFTVAQHERARSCLELSTTADAAFALGFTYRASLYLREYLYDFASHAADLPPLDRALRAAQRGVELSPESARAHEMLFTVLFARGDVAAAFEIAGKAIKLNKYDMRTLGAYGARLVSAGQIDKGLDILKQASAGGALVPAFEQFHLFLGNYLRNDRVTAAFHARQMTSDMFQLGLIARALVAASDGDKDAAQAALNRLVALNPAWRDDLRAALAKFFKADSIVDRLATDLTGAGIAAVH